MGFDKNNFNFDIEGLDELQGNLKQLAETGVKELNKGLNRLNNPQGAKTNSKAKVPEVCPYCGAKLPVDSDAATIKCEYCGAEYDNSNEKSIVDSVFDFVEKQQEIGQKEREKRLEIARLKAEAKLKKRKKSGFLRFVFLLIVVFAILYYYLVIMGGTIPF